MTTLNTIIEEMKRGAKEKALAVNYKNYDGKKRIYTFEEDVIDTIITTTAQRVREETIEECAVTVWNQWSKQSDGLEDTESSRAFARSVEAIRALSTLNK